MMLTCLFVKMWGGQGGEAGRREGGKGEGAMFHLREEFKFSTEKYKTVALLFGIHRLYR